MARGCPICSTRKLLILHEKYFCETCDVYFTSSLELCSLPIPSTTFSQPEPCPSCERLERRLVECKHFKEYIKRHVFCEACKTRLRSYLCYNFYKYFNFYRTKRRALSNAQSFLLALVFLLSTVSELFKVLLVFFSNLCCGFSCSTLLKLLVIPLAKIPFSNVFFLAFVCWEMARTVQVYRVPALFYEFNLQDGVDRLRISEENAVPFVRGSGQKLYAAREEVKSNGGCNSNRQLEKKVRNLKI